MTVSLSDNSLPDMNDHAGLAYLSDESPVNGPEHAPAVHGKPIYGP